MLHGVTMLHVLAIPICDFLKSSRLKPTACNIARLGARSTPSTTRPENSRWAVLVFTPRDAVLRLMELIATPFNRTCASNPVPRERPCFLQIEQRPSRSLRYGPPRDWAHWPQHSSPRRTLPLRFVSRSVRREKRKACSFTQSRI